MQIGPTFIDDTFAEAFGLRYARLVVTAGDEEWLSAAIQSATGYATSVIACDAEAGLEARLAPDETPDGRVGAALLFFGFSAHSLGKAVANRAGQCLMTCPTTAVYDGLPDAADRLALGKHIRFFGDGFQKSKLLFGRRHWRIPVMDGEFLIADTVGVAKGVGGGNLIVQGDSPQSAIGAARRAVQAIHDSPGVIVPFPGGVVRSGSKVGSKYKKLRASVNDAFCPTLRGIQPTLLAVGAAAAYELVIDGTSEEAVGRAMRAAMEKAAGPGVVAISAGNYGGNLGKFHFYLHRLLTGAG